MFPPNTDVTCDSVATKIDRQESGSCGRALSDSRRFNALPCPCAIAGSTQPPYELQLTGLRWRTYAPCRLDDQLQPPKLKCSTVLIFASLHQCLGDLLLMSVGACLGPRLYRLYRYSSKPDRKAQLTHSTAMQPEQKRAA